MGITDIGGNKESFRAIGNLDLNCHKEQQTRVTHGCKIGRASCRVL